jgi:hypothetical protein
MAILIALLFATWVRYADNDTNIESLKYDLDTITGNDYTIELKIHRGDYDAWKATHFDTKGRDAPAMAFKKVLAKKCEELLDKHSEQLVKHDKDEEKDEN